MDQRQLEQRIVERLQKWGRLPLSDLEAMLSPLDRLELSSGMLDFLERRGVIRSTVVGDEPVYELPSKEGT